MTRASHHVDITKYAAAPFEFVPAPSGAFNLSEDSGFVNNSLGDLFGEVPTDRSFFPGAFDSLAGAVILF